MKRVICLDGVPIALEVDDVEIELGGHSLAPADHVEGAAAPCCDGELWQPLMSYADGTTVYLHAPAEGREGPLGYRIDGPHRWTISFVDGPLQGRVARLSWQPV